MQAHQSSEALARYRQEHRPVSSDIRCDTLGCPSVIQHREALGVLMEAKRQGWELDFSEGGSGVHCHRCLGAGADTVILLDAPPRRDALALKGDVGGEG